MKFVPGKHEAARHDAPRTGSTRRSAFVWLPQSVHEQPVQETGTSRMKAQDFIA